MPRTTPLPAELYPAAWHRAVRTAARLPGIWISIDTVRLKVNAGKRLRRLRQFAVALRTHPELTRQWPVGYELRFRSREELLRDNGWILEVSFRSAHTVKMIEALSAEFSRAPIPPGDVC